MKPIMRDLAEKRHKKTACLANQTRREEEMTYQLAAKLLLELMSLEREAQRMQKELPKKGETEEEALQKLIETKVKAG